MSPTVDIENKQVNVEHVKNDWALALMNQGVIVKLAVSRWRATSKLTPEILGLRFFDNDSYNFMEEYIQLGRQNLLPQKILENIEYSERKARSTLEEYSFDTVWGRFVPFRAFKEWEEENQIIRKEFLENAMVISRNYNEIISFVKAEYKKMARDVWYRLHPQQGEPTVAFTSDFTDKIVEKIPSQTDIVSSFKYETTYFTIPMPSFVQENLAKVEQIKRQSEMEKFSSDLERETKRKISEEYVLRKRELIDGFLEATVVSMRSYVADLCDAVLNSLQRQGELGHVTLRHTKRLRDMIRKVKRLNFYDDNEINRLLSGLEIEVSKNKSELDSNIIAKKLTEIIEVSKKEFVPTDFNAISFLEL